MKKQSSILCLTGPTASGKTSLAIALADSMPIEIISVDSAMVYRGLNIGVAKPNVEELAAVPHHLIDIVEPNAVYSAAAFRTDALRLIREIRARGNMPVLVGGTMLYFRALLLGLDELPAADARVREAIRLRAQKIGWLALHQELEAIDPLSASRVHPNDQQRIVRAIEVYQLSGLPLSQLQGGTGGGRALSQVQFALPGAHCGAGDVDVRVYAISTSDRSALHRRIDVRFDVMLEQGLVKEVQDLAGRFEFDPVLPAMKSIGYRQVYEYLREIYDFETMVQKAKAASRQLAKRQITWLRGWEKKDDPRIYWLEGSAESQLEQIFKDLGC